MKKKNKKSKVSSKTEDKTLEVVKKIVSELPNTKEDSKKSIKKMKQYEKKEEKFVKSMMNKHNDDLINMESWSKRNEKDQLGVIHAQFRSKIKKERANELRKLDMRKSKKKLAIVKRERTVYKPFEVVDTLSVIVEDEGSTHVDDWKRRNAQKRRDKIASRNEAKNIHTKKEIHEFRKAKKFAKEAKKERKIARRKLKPRVVNHKSFNEDVVEEKDYSKDDTIPQWIKDHVLDSVVERMFIAMEETAKEKSNQINGDIYDDDYDFLHEHDDFDYAGFIGVETESGNGSWDDFLQVQRKKAQDEARPKFTLRIPRHIRTMVDVLYERFYVTKEKEIEQFLFSRKMKQDFQEYQSNSSGNYITHLDWEPTVIVEDDETDVSYTARLDDFDCFADHNLRKDRQRALQCAADIAYVRERMNNSFPTATLSAKMWKKHCLEEHTLFYGDLSESMQKRVMSIALLPDLFIGLIKLKDIWAALNITTDDDKRYLFRYHATYGEARYCFWFRPEEMSRVQMKEITVSVNTLAYVPITSAIFIGDPAFTPKAFVADWRDCDFKFNDIARGYYKIVEFCRNNKFQASLLLYIHQMYVSQSLSSDISITMSFLISNDVNVASMAIASNAGLRHLLRKRNRVETEAGMNFFETASNVLKAVVNSSLFSALRHIILVAVSWKLFGKDVASQIVKLFGKVEKMNFCDAVISIFESVDTIQRVAQDILNGMPITEALFAPDPLEKLFKEGDKLCSYENLLYYGLPVPDHMEARQFMVDSDLVVKSLKVFESKVSPFSHKSDRIIRLSSRLNEIRSSVRNRIASGARVEPFGICITGLPGIGKSSVLTYLYHLLSDIKGRSYEPGHVYERVVSSEYFDGYDMWGTPFIHYSEVGNSATDIAKRVGEPIISELTSVMDSVPMCLNMSKTEDKGKHFMNAEAIFFDTNNEDMNIKYTVNNAAAVRRRLLYIVPVVKQQYRIIGSNALDPDINDNGMYYDKWYFDVYSCVPQSNTTFIKNYYCQASQGADIYALERIIRNLYGKHIARGKASVQKKSGVPPFASPNVPPPPSNASSSDSEEDGVFHDVEYTPEHILDLGNIYACEDDEKGDLPGEESDPDTEAFSRNHTFLDRGLEFLNKFWKFLCYIAPDVWSIVSLLFALLLTFSVDFHRGLDKRLNFIVSGILFLVSYIWPIFRLLFYFHLFSLFLEESEHYTLVSGVRRVKEVSEDFKMYKKGLKNKIDTVFSFVSDRKVMIAAGTTGAIVSMFAIYKFFQNSKTTESYTNCSEENAEILVKNEEKYNCGNSVSRFKTKGNNATWNSILVKPSVHKGDLVELSSSLMRNTRKADILCDGKKLHTFVFGVTGSIALINLHSILNNKKTFTIKVYKNPDGIESEGYQETTIVPEGVVSVCNDLALIRLNGTFFKDVVCHFPEDLYEFTKAKGMIDRDFLDISYCGEMVAHDSNVGRVNMGPCVTYKWINHKKGMCGLPVVATRDSGTCIVGIHSAGSSGGNCYAIYVTRDQISDAIRRASVGTEAYCSTFSEGELDYGNFPHPKSPVNYENLGQIMYYGSVATANIRQKSKLEKSIFYDSLDEKFFEILSFVRTQKYFPPLMQPSGSGQSFISPYNNGIVKMSVSKKSLHPLIMKKTIEDVYSQLILNLGDVPLLQPLTLEVAVNGFQEDYFLRRINMSKAAGYGFGGSKSDYFDRKLVNDQVIDDPNDKVVEEVNQLISNYEKGNLNHPVFAAQLKDEPRVYEKVVRGKTRIFFATPLPFLIVQRMFLGPIYTLMVERCESFYTAIGIDMHKDADMIYDRITAFSHNVIEGDYGGYDQTMPTEIGRGACEIFLRLLSRFGYNEKQLKICEGILTDLMFPRVTMIGEMFLIPSLQPSGKYATAEDNSLRNLLIMVYCWNTFPESIGKQFFEFCLPIVYGDDVLCAVKQSCEWFNNISFASACTKNTDLDFTTSGKDKNFAKYVSCDEMTFLKRSFHYHNVLQRTVGELDLNSIYKTLQWRIPSKYINDMEQYEMICNSCLIEIYLHCHSKLFEKFRAYLTNVLKKHYKIDFNLYDRTKVEEILCPPKDAVCGGRQLNVSQTAVDSGLSLESAGDIETESSCERPFGRGLSFIKWPSKYNRIEENIKQHEEELRDMRQRISTMSPPVSGLSFNQIKQLKMYQTDPTFRTRCDEYFKLDGQIRARIKTIDKLWQWKKREGGFAVTESETVEMKVGEIEPNTVVKHENVTDVSGLETEHTRISAIETTNVGQQNSLSLDDFMKRPIVISHIEVDVETSLSAEYDLWDLFLSNPTVRSKLRNYAYLRGDLNLRIAISGTPFHYGKIMFSYQPMALSNTTLQYYALTSPLTGLYREMFMTYLSQSKECKVLDVKDNQPVEMKLPFISPQPVMRLFNNDNLILSDTDSYDDSVGFGKLYAYSLGDIKSATTPSTPIAITLYAWMENVKLGAPTGTMIEITTESDERKTGPKETMSTAQAAWMGLLKSPVISRYANASGKVLEGMSELSTLFGFSEPIMDNEPLRVNPQPYQNGCMTIGYNTGKRLGYDPKEELTVDPRIIGSSSDDMAINHMTSVESYLTSFEWNSEDLPLAFPIWKVPVVPTLCRRVPTFAANTYQPTALAYAAAPFHNWRGTIEFRFEVECSLYHRGKLAFIYEPNVSQAALIDTDMALNKQFVKILDLQEAQDISLCVNWAFARPWAKVPQADTLGVLGDPSIITSSLLDYANGYISVVPFNQLQSPQGGVIRVNVYVKSDDMMFNVLTQSINTQRAPVTESLTTHDVTCEDLNESTATLDLISSLHFGSVPLSFRTLLKRYATYQNDLNRDASPFVGTDAVLRYIHPLYPPAWPAEPTLQTFHLFGYLRRAFVGMRGSMRYRLNFSGGLKFSESNVINVSLREPQTSVPGYFFQTTSSISAINRRVTGTVEYVPHMNGGVEYEVPFYTNNAFVLSFVPSQDWAPSTYSLFDRDFIRGVDVAATFDPSSTGASITESFSTGDDFSFLRFQGAPPFSSFVVS